jgi:hypothetical protein
MRMEIYHLIDSPPLALKTVETGKKWSLRMARGRPEATNVGAALPFTGKPHELAIPNITCKSAPLELLKLFFTNFLFLTLQVL